LSLGKLELLVERASSLMRMAREGGEERAGAVTHVELQAFHRLLAVVLPRKHP
jgi:hypothetical protein